MSAVFALSRNFFKHSILFISFCDLSLWWEPDRGTRVSKPRSAPYHLLLEYHVSPNTQAEVTAYERKLAALLRAFRSILPTFLRSSGVLSFHRASRAALVASLRCFSSRPSQRILFIRRDSAFFILAIFIISLIFLLHLLACGRQIPEPFRPTKQNLFPPSDPGGCDR